MQHDVDLHFLAREAERAVARWTGQPNAR
jgi:hypothetical protein